MRSIRNPANAFGARNTPEVLRIVEIMTINQSRNWGVCSMNEFRKVHTHEILTELLLTVDRSTSDSNLSRLSRIGTQIKRLQKLRAEYMEILKTLSCTSVCKRRRRSRCAQVRVFAPDTPFRVQFSRTLSRSREVIDSLRLTLRLTILLLGASRYVTSINALAEIHCIISRIVNEITAILLSAACLGDVSTIPLRLFKSN